MTLFFPDVNVWIALSDSAHRHNVDSWRWLGTVPRDSRLVFSRFTQIGFLRLLTNRSVMGSETHNVRQAWELYDLWLDDPRVELFPEPRDVDAAFRRASEVLGALPASKAVGDCWLLAFATELKATLITFDRALVDLACGQGHPAVVPA